MTPVIYEVRIRHDRLRQGGRHFAHRSYLWFVDLTTLPFLPWWLRPFAQFRAADHLDASGCSIRQSLDRWLAIQGIDLAGGQVLMLAHARCLGHVFNPLTLYWCHRPDGFLECVVAEVHNTHGERHCYLLRPTEPKGAEVPKTFRVSPFLATEGRYVLRTPVPGERLVLSVLLYQHDELAFAATVRGQRHPATPRLLLRMILHWPWVTARTSMLIRRHGIAMHLRGFRPALGPYVTHPPRRVHERA